MTLTERLRAKRARIVGPVPTFRQQVDAMASDAEDLAHYVYRIFAEDGELLYIGCTREPHTRINQHYDGALFNLQMARWTCWRYPNRREALRAEAEAIGAEDPAYNVIHRRAS